MRQRPKRVVDLCLTLNKQIKKITLSYLKRNIVLQLCLSKSNLRSDLVNLTGFLWYWN